MRKYFRQWEFFKGWSNELDLIRIGFEWVDYQTAKLLLILIGFRVTVHFPLQNINEYRRRLREYWYPCPECGMKYGKHDPKVDHIPF